MSELERITITLPADMAALVRGAVNEGYASSSEVIREALRDWKVKRALHLHEFEALRSDIEIGLRDLAKGKVKKFDAAAIIRRGKKLLEAR